MECIFCNTELDGAVAVCDQCAEGQLKDDWYTEGGDAEGISRLLRLTDVVAVLDRKGYTITLDGAGLAERIDALPRDETGYTALCHLFNALMEEVGQPLEADGFLPPPFAFVRDAIRRIEWYEDRFGHRGSGETYIRLSLLYNAASRHFWLPYVSAEYLRRRATWLAERSGYWRERKGAGDSLPGNEERKAAVQEAEEAHAALGAAVADTVTEVAVPGGIAEPAQDSGSTTAGTEELEIEPKVEMLRKRIVEIAEQVKTTIGAAATDALTQPGTAEKGEPLFVRNTRKRAYLHYLAYNFETALREIMMVIEGGMGMEHDYALASVLALRTGKHAVLDELQEQAKSKSLTLDSILFKAVLGWKDGRWGRTLQLAEREMRQGNYAAGFLLKKALCEQYTLREKQEELDAEEELIGDLQSGIDKLSAVFLSVGAWGAAMQTMSASESSEWSAETWTSMGMALEEKGDIGEAEESYRKAMELNGLLLPAIVREALLQSKLGMHEEALATLKRARQLEPSVLRLQAAELVELGRREEALELLEALLRQDEDDTDAATLGLRLSMELGRSDMERMFRLYIHRRESDHGLKD